MNDRGNGIALIRQWARDEIEFGTPVKHVYRDLRGAVMAVLDEFRVEHDLAGTRYWCHPESDSHFTTEPGESISSHIADECVELTRYEFLSREGLHFGYEDRL